jgi:DNA-binding CsgD family transcriptional regulator/N-acetylneuraminic acid mutarotase
MQNDLQTNGTNELTEREQEILRLVATGTSNKDIAHQLFISTNTVKVHLRNIFAKIDVTSRTEAAVYAIREGLSQAGNHPGVDAAIQGLSGTVPISSETKRRSLFLWIAVVAAVVLVGIVTVVVIRYRTPKVAGAGPAAVTPQRWHELAALPTARSGLAVAVDENMIYAIGGKTDLGVTGMIEQYNVASNKWLTLKSKPVPVSDINAAVIGGRIYIPGGRLASGSMTNILETYDPSRNLWEKLASLPVALCGYGLVSFEGKLYVFGGWDGLKYLASVYEYDPDQDKWFERKSMPTARAFAGAAVAGGKIYVLGGYDGKEALPSNEAYLPNRDTWSQSAQLPAGRYGMGVASIADLIYVVGGVGKTASALQPLQYSYQQDQWQTFEEPPPQSWSDFGLVPLQSHLYAVGGQLNGLPAALNLSYQAIFTLMVPIAP